MASIFPDYAGWIAGVRDWLDVDDLIDSQIVTCLSLAQNRMNREFATFEMEKLTEVTITAPMSGLPIDLITAIPDFNKIFLVVPFVNGAAMDVVAWNEYNNLVYSQTQGNYPGGLNIVWNSPAIYLGNYCIYDGKLYTWPVPVEDNVMQISYYVKVPPLSATVPTTIFTENNSDALLYAACLEASAFIVEDERVQLWQAKYDEAKNIANNYRKGIGMGSTVLKRQIRGLS
jgi:hypothetical protein